jgi:hypothetical protein
LGSDEPPAAPSRPQIQGQGLNSNLAAFLAIALFFAVGFSFMVGLPFAMAVWLINGAFAWKLARDRARNGGLWAGLSLVLGPLGPFIVLSLPSGIPDSFVTGLASGTTDVTIPVARPAPSVVARVTLIALAILLLIFGVARMVISPTTPSRSDEVRTKQPPEARDSEADSQAKQLDALKKDLEKARREAEEKRTSTARGRPSR